MSAPAPEEVTTAGAAPRPASFREVFAVREGTAYPAVLFTTFESDTRVDPLHGRKLAAALQHATTSDAPVVLRRETSVGHGARAVSRTVGLAADQLAFLAGHTGPTHR